MKTTASTVSGDQRYDVKRMQRHWRPAEPPWQHVGVGTRIVIVDRQRFFCESLRAGLHGWPDISVAGVATQETQAYKLVEVQRPDVVLTEVALAAGSGLDLARRVGNLAEVLILTRLHEGDVILEAAAQGCAGCISHDISLADLVPLIMQVTRGGFVVHQPRLQAALQRAGAMRNAPQLLTPSLGVLTAREREVLDLLASGSDNDAIGRALYVSPQTVRTHVGKILRKLGVHSRAEAARLVMAAKGSGGRLDVARIEGPKLGGQR